MMRGILYSPLASLSVSQPIVSAVFIDEFQLMFAMNISSVSILYGSPAQALRITVCIMPCADSGYAHENAWSIRRGLPLASTSRSSGACTKPSGAASSTPFAWRVLPGRFGGGMGFGNGGW